MRIVNLKTLLALPAGTVFGQYENFGQYGLYAKAEEPSKLHDCEMLVAVQVLVGEKICLDAPKGAANEFNPGPILTRMEGDAELAQPVSTTTVTHIPVQVYHLFAVYEDTDTLGLIAALTQSLIQKRKTS